MHILGKGSEEHSCNSSNHIISLYSYRASLPAIHTCGIKVLVNSF